MKKRNIPIHGAAALILFMILTLLLIHPLSEAATGAINLFIIGRTITIQSPQNTTYNFTIGSTYSLGLNVSGDFTSNATWRYTLRDIKHSTTINQSVLFTPNASIVAVRWSNNLTVYVNETTGTNVTTEVLFYINVNNSAPRIDTINNTFFACEGAAFSRVFNATDGDEDSLTPDISPKDPFFVNKINETIATLLTHIHGEIFSGTLNKTHVNTTYRETLSVSDGQYVDTRQINITVLEINNAPTIEDVGVRTVYLNGSNSTFYEEIDITDTEDGNRTTGNVSFNITFTSGTQRFNITQLGVINYTPTSSHLGNYTILVCVNDRNLTYVHPNLTICGALAGTNRSACDTFSLTVTDANRAPTITAYSPTNQTPRFDGTTTVTYNVSTHDPDSTIPDIYWYVDGSFRERDSDSNNGQLSLAFGCDVSGSHRVKAEITDGLLNDSVQWNVTVREVTCPVGAAGGAGGGQSVSVCVPKWGCGDWNVCQNTELSLEIGIINREDYRMVSKNCTTLTLDKTSCGFQIRSCIDVNTCNRTLYKPNSIDACTFVEQPSCNDGVKNCHRNQCEFLVDCGGPCKPCATCSDGIQNQGEQDVDCGGPCPWQCVAEKPAIERIIEKKSIRYSFWIILLLLLIIILLTIIQIARKRKQLTNRRYDERRALFSRRLWKEGY